ncbi:MAG: hypothetical protein WCE62_09150 [Polyangiales bacterium]
MRWYRLTGLGVAIVALGCGSSEPVPVDPLAADYCAICSEFPSCERVVTDTLNAACPDETSTYYQCVTDNECDVTACESEWAARAICMDNPS